MYDWLEILITTWIELRCNWKQPTMKSNQTKTCRLLLETKRTESLEYQDIIPVSKNIIGFTIRNGCGSQEVQKEQIKHNHCKWSS